MNKLEFLEELSQRLAKLPTHELERTRLFYAESIDDRIEDGMSEQDAVASLGSPEEIAADILINDSSLTEIIKDNIKSSREKSGNKTLWMVLAICGFPIWFPLGIAFAAVIFAVYVTVWAVVFSLFAAGISLLLAGIGGTIMGVVFCFIHGLSTGLFVLGGGVMCTGLFIMCMKPLMNLCRQFINMTKSFLRWIKKLFVFRGVR